MPFTGLFSGLALVVSVAAAAAPPNVDYVISRFKLVDADLDFIEAASKPSAVPLTFGTGNPFHQLPRHRILKDGDTIGGGPNSFSIIAEIESRTVEDKVILRRYHADAYTGFVETVNTYLRRPLPAPVVSFTEPFVHTEYIPPYSLGKDVVRSMKESSKHPGATDYWPARLEPGWVNVTAHVNGRADLSETIRLKVLPPQSSAVGGVCKIDLRVTVTRGDRGRTPMSAGIVAENGTLVQCLGAISRSKDRVFIIGGENAGRMLVGYEGGTDCRGEKALVYSQSYEGESLIGRAQTTRHLIVCYNPTWPNAFGLGFNDNELTFFSQKSDLAKQASGTGGQKTETGELSRNDALCVPNFSPYDSRVEYHCEDSAQRKAKEYLQPIFFPIDGPEPKPSEPLKIGGFFLVNAYTNKIVRFLSDGDAIGAEPYDITIIAEPEYYALKSVTFTEPFRTTKFQPYSLGKDINRPFDDYLPLKLQVGPLNVTAYVDEWKNATTTISLNVVARNTTLSASTRDKSAKCMLNPLLKVAKDSEAILSLGIAAEDGTIVKCIGSLPFLPEYYEVAVASKHVGRDLVVFEGDNYCSGVIVPQASKNAMSGPFRIVCDNYSSAEEVNVFVALSREDVKRLEVLGPASVFSSDGFNVGSNPTYPRVPICEIECRQDSLRHVCEDGVPCVSVKSPYSDDEITVCGNDEQRKANGCLQVFRAVAARICEACGVGSDAGGPFYQSCTDGVYCESQAPGVCRTEEQRRIGGCPGFDPPEFR